MCFASFPLLNHDPEIELIHFVQKPPTQAGIILKDNGSEQDSEKQERSISSRIGPGWKNLMWLLYQMKISDPLRVQ